ncbi:MAG: hypothetical protein U9Q03_04515 [Patescibacteria group bacterium]|nr:hypothetical protein [Patescibacteria group bacterium]
MEGPEDKGNKSLRDAVLATVVWFDVFGYPLTLPEVARYLPVGGGLKGVSLSDVAAMLDSSEFSCGDGYYSLKDGKGASVLRQRRYRLAKRKLGRARRAASLFGLMPSVRLVAVCNSLAVSNAEEGSDIDLFVVCRPGTLWATRFALAGTLKLFGLRPTPEEQKDKLCLSFWVSESEMDLSRYALPGGDPYMDFWIATLMPLYDAGGVFDEFRKVNEVGRSEGRKVGNGSGRIERLAKRIQMRKFPERIRAMANLDSRVVVSDDVLKFHVNDRRAVFRGRFREKLDSLNVKEI